MSHDVQLEHGFVRVAASLFEAAILAPFTDQQRAIVLAVWRLTYGWRRKSARVSQAQLAALIGAPWAGSFRRALHELVQHGVVLVLDEGHGRTPSALAIQKDFTAWGRFSQAPAALRAIWGERPEHADDLLVACPSEDTPPGMGVPTGTPSLSPTGHPDCPLEGTLTPPNSLSAQEFGTPTDRTDSDSYSAEQSSMAQAVEDERQRLADRLAPYTAVDVTAELLAKAPIAASLTHWWPLLHRLLDGDAEHGRPAVAPAVLAEACLAFAEKAKKYTSPTLVAFIENAVADAARPPARAGPRRPALSRADTAGAEAYAIAHAVATAAHAKVGGSR